MQKISKALLLASAAVLFFSPAAKAQNADLALLAMPAPSPTATPAASATPLSLADLTAQIVAAEEERGKIDEVLKSEPMLSANDAVNIFHEIEVQLEQSAKALAAGPSLEKVRELESRWQNSSEDLAGAKRLLTERVTRYEGQLKRLGELQPKYDKATPRELLARMEGLGAATRKTTSAVLKRRAELGGLLTKAEEQERQVNGMRERIKQMRPQAAARLFVSESVPLWRVPIWSESVRLAAGFDLAQESRAAWAKQWTALASYAKAQASTFFLHGLFFAVLLSALWWTRRRMRGWADDEPRLKRAAQVFEGPVAMALAFSLAAANWIYPEAPPLLTALVGAAALIPAILILRRVVDSPLYPVLNAMVVFYAIDQLRKVAVALPILARLLFVAEMAGGALALVWLLRSGKLNALRGEEQRLSKVTLAGARVVLGVFCASFLANLLGNVSLGDLMGNAALQSAYLAVVLYAAARIADGLILAGLSAEPLAQLGMVRRHRTLLWRRTHRIFELAALLLWASETLDLLTVRSPLIERAATLFAKPNTDLTIFGQALAFGAVVWAAFLISRFIRFALEEDFYPRIKMERGLSYAVSTMLHYAVLLVGFYMAASAAGIDMTKFNILVGAFGVGLGFGLQNIINNFVSGVILLFERPVKVGDVVQMSDASGVVDRIGIRASIIRTGSGSEIIVPNGKLISDQFTNWTLSNRRRGIDLPVSVPSSNDPCRIIELLTRIAAAHALVVSTPAPKVLLTDLGTDMMQFQLSAWTDHCEQWTQIRSDLAVAINAELLKEGISRTNPTSPVPVLISK
ncbi:MAG: mechanosensitive ion channel domain-containing protein [Verrucomicrobiota bacterium]